MQYPKVPFGVRLPRRGDTSAQPITVRQLFSKWNQSMLVLYKPSAQQFISTTMNQLRRQFGGMSVNEICTEGLQAYISKLKCSPKTVANRMTVFRA